MQHPGEAGAKTERTGAEAAPAAAVMLAGDQACIRCSYNLRGLMTTGVCPECGTPVADSLRGTLLQFASPEYLAAIHTGLALVLGAILATILLMVLGFFGGVAGLGGQVALVANGAGFLISIVSIVGYWRYTEVDPLFAGQEKPDAARRVVRGAIAVQAVGSAVSFAAVMLGLGAHGPMAGPGASATAAGMGLVSILAGLASGIAFIVQFFAVLLYTRWLARRVPDAYIIRRCGRYLWLLPVIAVLGSVLLLLGPLIALVLYWNLLDRLRRHLRAIRSSGAPAPLPGVAAR